MADLAQYVALTLNLLLVPVCKLLWDMNGIIKQLEAQMRSHESNTQNVRVEISQLRDQVGQASIVAANAANAAALSMSRRNNST